MSKSPVEEIVDEAVGWSMLATVLAWLITLYAPSAVTWYASGFFSGATLTLMTVHYILTSVPSDPT